MGLFLRVDCCYCGNVQQIEHISYNS